MALFTYSDEIFIDPAISGNSGSGSKADPWSNFTTMLATEVMSSSGGKRINVKAGVAVAEVADLDWTTTFFASNIPGVGGNPLAIQGYTTDEEDRGIGEWNGNALYVFLVSTTIDSTFLIDLHLHNSGSARILQLDDFCGAINCEFNNSSHATPVVFDDDAQIIGNHFHDGVSIEGGDGATFLNNKIIDDKTNQSITTKALVGGNDSPKIIGNLIWLDTAGIEGIRYGNGSLVLNNSVFQNAAGTGGGIVSASPTSQHTSVLLNNLVEGFSGTGGQGIEVVSSRHAFMTDGNYVSDCTNGYVNVAQSLVGDSDNEDIADTSPFVDGAAKNFAQVDTGNVKEGSLPAIIGAAVTS